MNKNIYEEPLEDARSGDVVGGPYDREKSLRGFYLIKGGLENEREYRKNS